MKVDKELKEEQYNSEEYKVGYANGISSVFQYMKVKMLKMIRIVCIIPFIWLLIIAFLWSWNGIDGGYFGTNFSGPIAFVLILLSYGMRYCWIGIICICIIILTSIMLYKQRKSDLMDNQASNVINTKNFEISTSDITIKMATDKTYLVENRMVDGRPCIVIPVSDHVNINGITVKPINVDSKEDPGEDK